jgi:hypothetical protein
MFNYLITHIVCWYKTLYQVLPVVWTNRITTRRNRIIGIMVSMLASSAVDRAFESQKCHTKDFQIGICYFSAKHETLRKKSKDWLAWNQNNVSERSDMSTHGLLFQCASTIQIQLSMMV